MFKNLGWALTALMLTLLLFTACDALAEQSQNSEAQANVAALAENEADEPLGTPDISEGSYPDESGEATPWGSEDELPAQQAQTTPETVQTTTPEPTDAPPSPAEAADAETLWRALQEANYQEDWSTIPGKGVLYPGQAPHGALISTYLNPDAARALETKPGRMPDGAVILKENHTSNETLNSVTVMQKRAGYDTDYGDWFWAKYGADGSVQAAGQVASCISCHGAVRSNDYVFSFPIAPIRVDGQSSAQETRSPTPNSTPTPEPTAEATPTSEAAPAELSAQELVSNGESHFSANCAACHQSDGQGVGNIYPALAGNEFVTQAEVQPIIEIVLNGQAGMPSFQDEFTDQTVAEVLSYVRNAWNNDASVVRTDTVSEVRSEVGSEREAADTDQ